MDYKVGTAYGQSEGLQVLGIGKPWPIYLEGMEECYITYICLNSMPHAC